MDWRLGTTSWKWWPVTTSEPTQAHQPTSPLCRQLADVVRELYLSGPEKAKSHGVLADFFSGAWSQGIKKLITLPLVGKPLNLDRKVRCPGAPAPHSQPLHFCAAKPGPRARYHSLFPPQTHSASYPSFPTKDRKSPNII